MNQEHLNLIRWRNMNAVKFSITSTDAKEKPTPLSLEEIDEDKWKLFPGALR